MGRIMAVDYGLKRTGLAVTDENQQFAFALETVPTGTVFTYLEKYFSQHPVDAIVVGEPRRLDNTPTDSTPAVEAFIRGLQRRFPAMPVHRMDERFTSGMAKQAIIDSGVARKDRRDKSMVDMVSAAIILQSWLQQREFRAGL